MSFLKTIMALFKGQIKCHTGQFGEDIVIKKLFDRKKKNGFYVDLGANHPFLHSNTAFFWLKGNDTSSYTDDDTDSVTFVTVYY